jgi:uncharacterized integral membrane protein
LPPRLLLLLPLLSPLLVTLWVAAINPRPLVSLRFLTFRSAPLPLGVWVAMAALGGATISGTASALALRQDSHPLGSRGRRSVDRAGSSLDEPFPGRSGAWRPPVHGSSGRGHQGPSISEPASMGSSGPMRPPGEPAPTVSVPFRVIRRGPGQSVRSHAPVDSTSHQAAPATVSDDWVLSEEEEW